MDGGKIIHGCLLVLRCQTGDEAALRELTERVLRRDRRRVWLLGIVCVIAWMMVAMLPWATVLPMLAKIAQTQPAMQSATPQNAPDQQRLWERAAEGAKAGTIATFVDSIVSILVAAVSTVLFLVFSHRATLRQVNARLREISAHLKLLTAASK